MPELFEITIGDVKNLNDFQLTALMQCLLSNELVANQLPRSNVYVSFDINVQDGGADGIVGITSPDVISTDHIPDRNTVFQSKSGTLKTGDFTNELFVRRSNKKRLKPRVKDCFDSNGAYVLFYGKTCAHKSQRVAEMKAAVRQAQPDLKAPNITILDCSSIVLWAKKHLAALVHIAQYTGKTSLLSDFVTWAEWSGYEDLLRNQFVRSADTDEHISRIEATFLDNKQIQRLIGQSGLGKTRIALEAFRPSSNPTEDTRRTILSDSVAYAAAPSERLVSAVLELRRLGISGTLVVDNCSRRVHETLEREVRHADSRLNLLTIDHNIKDEPLRPGEFLVKKADMTTLRRIVQFEHPTLRDYQLDIIAQYADGYPEIAARLSDAPLEEKLTFDANLEETLTDNLIWGRATPDDKKYDVITALALFANIGYSGRFEPERDFIAANICDMRVREFQKAASSFMPRILDRIGDFVRVSPLPLAVRLAELWYRRTDTATVVAMFADESMPPRLATSRAERFSELGELGQAQEIARRLMDPNAPFGKAEVINTDQGSRVFRSLSEVNPASAIDTLLREFGSWSVEELRDRLGPGRRHIVWALEAIAFHSNLFLPAMRMLALLAVAENENIGNNATGDYIGHFQVLLAGTEADFTARIAAIDELLSLADERFIRLAIRALGRVVIDSTGRTVGAERQGGRVLEDYTPETYGEIHAYFSEALERLADLACDDNALGDLARARIARGIRYVVRYTPAAIGKALRKVVGCYKRAWPDALEGIENTLRYDSKRLPDEVTAEIRSWTKLLEPTSLTERIRLTISIPPYGMDELDDGTFRNIAEERAQKMADEIGRDVSLWLTVVRQVSSGEQRQAFPFGERIAKLIPAEQYRVFAGLALTALDSGDQPNPNLLMGFLSAASTLQRDVAKVIVREVCDAPNAARFACEVAAVTSPDADDMMLLMSLLQRGVLEPANFYPFSYKGAVTNLTTSFMADYFRELSKFGIPGAQALLQILSSYLYGDDGSRWAVLRSLMRDIVLTPGLFNAPQHHQMEHYYLEKAVIKLLDDPGGDPDLAARLAEEIVRVCKQHRPNFSSYDVMRPIAFAILAGYQEAVWPVFKEALQSAKDMTRFHLLNTFEVRSAIQGEKFALMLLPDTVIDQWLDDQPTVAALVLARHVPLFRSDEQELIINPIIERLLTLYGSVPGVLSELGANLEEFGFVGSLVPGYQRRLEFVRRLTAHKVPEVAAWARRYVSSLDQRVRSQEKRDKEWKSGILSVPPFADDI